PELIFEHDRLQRNVIMRQEVFTSLLRAQEQTQIDAVRDTPLFTVLDQPTGSAEQQSRRTILSALLAFVLGVLLAVSIAFFREFARRSRAVQDPSYTEFQTLVRLAWEDLRHPLRWIRSKQPSGVTADR